MLSHLLIPGLQQSPATVTHHDVHTGYHLWERGDQACRDAPRHQLVTEVVGELRQNGGEHGRVVLDVIHGVLVQGLTYLVHQQRRLAPRPAVALRVPALGIKASSQVQQGKDAGAFGNHLWKT